jgi:peptide/nickel transport system substrate-binding protein
MNKIKMLVALMLAVVLVAGCSGNNSNTAPSGSGEGSPNQESAEGQSSDLKTPKDSLVFLSAESLTGQWDTTTHTILGQMRIESLLFDKLFDAKAEAPDTEKLDPNLALSAEQLDDKTIEYKLRQGVKFHDGTEFTAEDVKATFEYASQPDKASFGWFPGVVKGKVIDKYTVQLSTETPSGSLWFSAAFIPILAKKDIDAHTLAEKPNGTGPFKLSKQEGDTTILERNDTYWKGQPQLKYINWKYVPDSSTRLLSLKAGEADVIDRLEPEQAKNLESTGNITVQKVLTPESKWLIFRNSGPFKDNEKLRQAIAYAIDRNAILELMGEAGGPAKSFVMPAKFGYAEMEWPYEYDPEKAKSLLAEAGYPNGQGLPELEYITSSGFYPKTKEYGELIVAQLQMVGIKSKLTVLETAAWLDKLYNVKEGNMIDTGWMTGNPEPDLVLRPLFYSKSARITGSTDAEIDASLDKEASVANISERRKVLQTETFPLLAQKLPAIPLFNSVLLTGVRNEVTNFKIYPTVVTVDIVNTSKQ